MLSIEKLHELFIEHEQKITTDTRKIEKGSIFFALKGDNFDANTFAQKAIEAGSGYAVVDNPSYANHTNILCVNNVLETLQNLAKYHRQSLKIPVIGITGSNGKTTNKELIHAVLSKKYNTYATKGNLNNHIGVPLTLLSIKPSHEMAIVEMGANHQGEIAMLSELSNPDFGLITNIGKAHLEGFGGVEGIKKGKSELFKFIKSKNGKIFINADDKVLEELSNDIEKITFGLKTEYDVHGKLFANTEYVEFAWNVKNQLVNGNEVVKTQLFGHYNFINTLCAACVGNYFNVSTKDINGALAEYMPEMNRSQVKKTERNTLILDAYNANPSSMQLAISHFINQNFENKLLILGDMLELGIYSKDEHLSILNQLQHHHNIQVILVGEQFFELKSQFSQFNFFFSNVDAEEYIKTKSFSDFAVLIKGSRGIKLEKLVDSL